ncbi:SPRY domain-containing SOCS box protein 3 isoform X1 [Oenanthe melanoleuca]|uniref:SPRY domain-containing SOCS box protein 3 isoform X1 n=2 Tax=Oenanthe melanoleuca TaxID=2939378 RepID=UPI0024C16121|nr:SPRY domain-containing SOCS box protein 3 isoform X1 [Oenanthe melanoleuca]
MPQQSLSRFLPVPRCTPAFLPFPAVLSALPEQGALGSGVPGQRRGQRGGRGAPATAGKRHWPTRARSHGAGYSGTGGMEPARTMAELISTSADAYLSGGSMARRPRSSRAWHFVLSGVRREADGWAGARGWGYDSDGQHSDSDSEPEFSSVSPSIPSAIPVTGESYCNCENQSEAPYCSSLHALHRVRDCRCGEEDEYFDWVWDDLNKSTATLLTCDNRKVNFHMEYSCGTAAIRGNKELADGQHFWEIKMTSPVYGTDMMVGIGTSDVNLDKYRHTFCSLLGKDEDSWGLSYTGLLHHKGDKTNFSSRFGQGSIIGVHLDTWHGTLTFFKNRKCIGVAATKLQNKKFYPMVCSTAAKSSMKVIRSCASRTSLQYLCCFRLRQLLPHYVDTLEVLPLPPGLKQVLHNKLGWVLSMNYSTSKPSSSSGSDSDSSCGSDAEACQRKRCRRT